MEICWIRSGRPMKSRLASHVASRFAFEVPLDGDRADRLRAAQSSAVQKDPLVLYSVPRGISSVLDTAPRR